jgi:hypothetical protein
MVAGVGLLLVAGCASTVQVPNAREPQTMLLVSLSDGSIIRQEIDVEAEVCLKTNGDPLTTCLTSGEPVYAADGKSVIGYRMQAQEIQLLPK